MVISCKKKKNQHFFFYISTKIKSSFYPFELMVKIIFFPSIVFLFESCKSNFWVCETYPDFPDKFLSTKFDVSSLPSRNLMASSLWASSSCSPACLFITLANSHFVELKSYEWWFLSIKKCFTWNLFNCHLLMQSFQQTINI